MLKSELLEIIANGENSGVEFKRDDIRPEQLAREIVAMSNLNGGLVLLGVEDDGQISGIQRENLEQWVMNSIAEKVHPMIIPFYEEIQIDSQKRVAVISFTQGISKPYVVRDRGREDIYIRVASTSRLATREQQLRLFESGGHLHNESLPVAGTSFASLSKGRLEDYLGNLLDDPDVPHSDDGWRARLLGLGYLTEGFGGKAVCTIAGLTLFGNSPRRFLPQAGIRVMAFSGEDKQYRALLDEILDYPMVGLWRKDDRGQRQMADAEMGMIEHLLRRITPFISDEQDTINEGFRREREWHYPREAVRELVINALAHRDWTRTTDIELCLYSDRLELISPGTLQNSMTIEKMLAGQRSPRNPLIVDVLRDYGYVDARGMGVRTKIVPLMRSANLSEPEFVLTDDFLKTILYKKAQST